MKKIDAYLTVEAALVLPIVFMVQILIIYLWFFQYDRCLMEQGMASIALRGCTLQMEDKTQIAQKLYQESEQMNAKNYLAWDVSHAEVVLKGSRVNVKQSGSLKFPFQNLAFRQGEGAWSSSAVYENHRISPMAFIRNCRRIMGGK